MLTADELERYSRQISIFGEEGQLKLKRTKVLIAGAGGLGSASATYLTVAGIGKMRIVDHDVVALSNLNRQILHWDSDIRTIHNSQIRPGKRQDQKYRRDYKETQG